MDEIKPLCIGDIEIHWLKGDDFRLNGGTMLGAAPKALWQKRYEADDDNCTHMCNVPLLMKIPENTNHNRHRARQPAHRRTNQGLSGLPCLGYLGSF